MKRLLILAIIPFAFSACQSTQYGLYRPVHKPLGEEVNRPFVEMVQNGKQTETTIGHVYFEYDHDRLTSDAKKKLNQLAHEINRRSGQVMIVGHADHNNTEQYNKRLGYLRALEVMNYLKSAGVWQERMVIRSFGENRPTSTNYTDAGQALNRRVEIAMFAQGEGMSGAEAERAYKRWQDRGKEKPAPKPQLFMLENASGSSGGE